MCEIHLMRENLIDAYIDVMVKEMDTLTLQQMVAETLYETLKDYTDSELKEEIDEYHPELLENPS